MDYPEYGPMSSGVQSEIDLVARETERRLYDLASDTR